jgi:hypothetical protein
VGDGDRTANTLLRHGVLHRSEPLLAEAGGAPPRKNLAIVWLGRIARSFLPVPLFDFMGYAAEQTGRMGCLFGALQSLLAPVSSSLCLQDIVPQGSLGTICRGKAVKGVIKVTLLILLLVFPQFAL